MVSVVRCWKAEYQKCKHSILLYMHSMNSDYMCGDFCGLLSYIQMGTGNQNQCLSGSASRCVPVSDRHYCGPGCSDRKSGRALSAFCWEQSHLALATYIGKLSFLMICAFGATFLALGTFAALYRDAPASLYLKAGILLLITMLPIYLIHLFVGMSFGKGASMGLGIAGSLIAALMITGLGDATWKYIPWAWGVRAMDYTVLAWDSPQLYAQVKTDFFSGMIISVCCTVCLLIASLVWFHGWEGGKNSE